jgi:hypothetical protein
MAGPIKPIKRDYPLSATPEPINSLSLSRANALERRTPKQIVSDAGAVYEKETLPADRLNSKKSKAIIKNGVIQSENADKIDSIRKKAWPRFQAAYDNAKSKNPNVVARDLEKNLKAKYKKS